MVVELCDRSNRRSGIAGNAALIDGDGWRQTIDTVHVWFFELTEKLPCIRRQRFHVTALALRKQCVERETRLSGARNAGNYHELAARYVDVQIFQIVYASTRNGNVVDIVIVAAICLSEPSAFLRGDGVVAGIRSRPMPTAGVLGWKWWHGSIIETE